VNRRAITLTVALASFALPASSLAASSHGTVLSVDRSHHLVQVVDAAHHVHAYRYGGSANVRSGSRIRFHVSGKDISAVKNLGQSSTVTFYAKVVGSRAQALVLRLADGNRLTIGGKQLRHAKASAPRGRSHAHAIAKTSTQPIAINIEGLQTGETVLVTESTDAQGNLTITIELTGTSSGSTVSEQQASGVVSDVQSSTFAVTTADGSVLNLHMAEEALANLNISVCDQVTVSYHQDAGMFIADNAQDGGPATTGACAGDGSGGDQDAVGGITSVSGTSVTIDQGAGQGPLTFTVADPSITSGYSVGDVVDVTYTQLANGSLDASDVQYVENDATGVVTAVSAGSVTISDGSTGNPATFTADPTTGTFDGVHVGDVVDVTYHVAAGGGMVADNLDNGGSGS
jgi:hypothetical protein